MGPDRDVSAPGEESFWAAEQFRLVLEALRYSWGDAYEIGVSAGLWTAVRRDGKGKLEEAGPEKLRNAILADYELLPVPRDVPLAEGGDLGSGDG
jgi:hypothetical protein